MPTSKAAAKPKSQPKSVAKKAKAKPKAGQPPSLQRTQTIDQHIKEQFEFFDSSQNGTIELEELTLIMRAVGGDTWTPEKLAALLKAMDTNNDGRVQYEEFVDWIFRNRQGGEEKALLSKEDMSRAKDGLAEQGRFDLQASDDLLQQAVSAHYYKDAMKEKALSLLDSKADPNFADRHGTTVLMHMATKIDATFAKQMIDARADVTKHSPDFSCPIFIAASKNDTDLLRIFIMPDTTPVETEANEEDAELTEEGVAQVRERLSKELVSQMRDHTRDRLRELTQGRADINFKDSSGWTPLTMATFVGRRDCVEFLLKQSGHGSKKLRLDIKNRTGRTALHIAARKDLVDIIELLVKNSASPDIKDPDGWTPVHHACFHGNSASVALLVSLGATVDIKGFHGLTPFQVTRLRQRAADLDAKALDLLKVPAEVDFAKCMLPILKDETKSPYAKIEDLLSLPGVYQNMSRLRLHEQFFDPVLGPNKVKLQKYWSLLIRPLMQNLRTGEVDMPLEPPANLSDDDKEDHLREVKSRQKLQRSFFEMWCEATKGPPPSVDWTHDNRSAYKDELQSLMNGELAIFKQELDDVYRKVGEADCGPELIDLPANEVCEPSLLSQLGAHPAPSWLETLDLPGAFEQLRLVGAVPGKEDDAATFVFAEMLTYEKEFLSGTAFWKNIYRKWLACYGKMADFEFQERLKAVVANFNSKNAGANLSASYSKGPLKTYPRMKEDERDRGLHASAASFEGRTTAASCLDVIRGTIYVDSPQAVLAVLDCFRQLDGGHTDKLKLVQVNNFFNEAVIGMDSFRYVEMNVLFRCGQRAGACGRDDKTIPIALVGEVAIVLNDYASIKQRRSLQYKLWRGFFDWAPQEGAGDKAEGESDAVRLQKRGNAGLYEDDG
eukprot:TRINITY_DN21673_c0_g1_i1.p1 TRINITY_DN21673_c0_g1~~TRINITY_DN21673_c0_g1_i1.p1  ORF type:complete len:912 (-),score=231.28 TRINITY_DN21673_c0_g1_i1:227-2908(-)